MLALLLLLAGRGRTIQARMLNLATFFCVLWMLCAGGHQLFQTPSISLHLVIWIEWLAKSVLLASIVAVLYPSLPAAQIMRKKIAVGTLLLIAVSALQLLLSSEKGNAFEGYFAQLLLSIWCVLLLEQLNRYADKETSWALRPFVIALGGAFTFDLYMYSEALLIRGINPAVWDARGFLHLALPPLLLLSSRRTTDWQIKVFISRDVVFHSTMLLVVGGYLVLMSMAGYYIKFSGGSWSGVYQIVFYALASLILLSVLLSETVRRNIKVFITKHFFANKYDYRLEWLSLSAQLGDQATMDCYHQALKAMANTLQSSGGLLLMLNGGRLIEKARQNHSGLSSEAIAALCQSQQYFERTHWIVDLSELDEYPQRYQGLELGALANDYRLWLVLPLFYRKKLYGYIVLCRSEATQQINWEDRDLLNTIGRQLVSYLALQEASEELAESKQFDAFNRMSAFVVHDLKNVLAQLKLVVVNGKKFRNNPEFIDDSFDTLANAVNRMERMLSDLRRNQPSIETKRAVSVANLLNRAVKQRSHELPVPGIHLAGDCNLFCDEDKLLSVLNHLIQNAQEATSEHGEVEVILEASSVAETMEIIIRDTGSGMAPDFIRHKLFKPFETTKGNAGMGIGVYESRQFIESLGGELKVDSQVGQGSTFSLCLPTQRLANSA